MPPRKKATAAGAAPATTRASARIKSASTSTQPATTSDSKSKRGHSESESENDAQTSKHVSKKARKTKKQDADDQAVDTTISSQPAPDEPKKMVTVVKRGAAPVDPSSKLVATHQVYANDEAVWDAMLNQTDVSAGQNKNKFYVLQLLHPIGNNSQSSLFTHWGRVGEDGQSQLKGPWPPSAAINEFKKQFKAKAGVPWENRVGMIPKKGKYMWLARDFEEEEMKSSSADNAGSSNKKEVIIPDSTLEAEVQVLCNLIFSTSLIDAHLSSMNYDANKLPLGKLAKSTILQGFGALKTLAEVIENPNGDTAKEHGGFQAACEQLTSYYYSIIPHDFGRQKGHVIRTADVLKRELELVDALGDMEVASKLISSTIHTDDLGNPVNPLDAKFRSLGLTSMTPVKQGSQEFQVLESYARDTHGETHRHLNVRIMNAYRVERAGEKVAWANRGFDSIGDGERLLLWHGSRTTNFAGILKQGLRIAPPEAPVTGYMFGKGVYFADMMSKSANYCYAGLSNNTGLLLLCEVAAKPFYEQISAQYDADMHCRSNQKMATKGIGRTQPVKWKDAGKALNNAELLGCHMPDGPGRDVALPGVYLQYNEYIVYDPSQIRLKYLLMVNM